jgi:Skp family chaperone for outer membrane proteins
MKAPIKSLLIASLAFVGAIGAHAQTPAPKPGFCDMAKIFAGYYQTDDQQTKLNQEKAAAANIAKQMQADGKEIVGKFNAAYEKMGKMDLTQDARDAAKKEAQDLQNQAQQKNADLQKYISDVQTQLTTEFNTYKLAALNSITDAATKIAKDKNINILIDKSPSTTYQTTIFVYIDPAYPDITDDVLAAMNQGHDKMAPAADATKK